MLGVVFDVEPGQISKLKLDISMLHIGVNGQNYIMDFAGDKGRYDGAIVDVISPLIGLAVLGNRSKKADSNGVSWWFHNLQAYAPYARATNNKQNMPMIIGITLGVTLLIIVLIGVIVAIAG